MTRISSGVRLTNYLDVILHRHAGRAISSTFVITISISSRRRVITLSSVNSRDSAIKIFNMKNSTTCPHIRVPSIPAAVPETSHTPTPSVVFNFLMDFAVDVDGNHQFRSVPPYLIKSYLGAVRDRRVREKGEGRSE